MHIKILLQTQQQLLIIKDIVAKPSHGYAIEHIPVPVPSQDKLGGLRQEGHPA